MSYYVPASGMTYPQYVQAKSLVDGIRWDIQASHLTQIATKKELENLRFDVRSGSAAQQAALEQHGQKVTGAIDTLNETASEGFLTLHNDLQAATSAINNLGALFDWHLVGITQQLGHLGDTLEQLVGISASPEQTWAYEQFEAARLACRRQLFPEAVTFLDRAINGYSGHTGYPLDHRFHYWQGMIYANQGGVIDTDLLDLDKAEAAFNSAARYARVDFPEDAALALAGAAYVASCRGNFSEAIKRIGESIKLNPSAGEYQYQLSRYCFQKSDTHGGLTALRNAVWKDARYALKWMADSVFSTNSAVIRQMFEEWRRELLAYEPALNALRDAISRGKKPLSFNVFLLYGTKGVWDLTNEQRASVLIEKKGFSAKLLADLDSDPNRANNTFIGLVQKFICVMQLKDLWGQGIIAFENSEKSSLQSLKAVRRGLFAFAIRERDARRIREYNVTLPLIENLRTALMREWPAVPAIHA